MKNLRWVRYVAGDKVWEVKVKDGQLVKERQFDKQGHLIWEWEFFLNRLLVRSCEYLKKRKIVRKYKYKVNNHRIWELELIYSIDGEFMSGCKWLYKDNKPVKKWDLEWTNNKFVRKK